MSLMGVVSDTNAHTIRFVRGDTHVIKVSATSPEGTPYVPLATDILTMTVRVKTDRGAIVIQKKTGDTDVITGDTGWQITIQPEDTAGFGYVDYVYDIQLKMGDVIKTIIPMSRFIIDKEVTY